MLIYLLLKSVFDVFKMFVHFHPCHNIPFSVYLVHVYIFPPSLFVSLSVSLYNSLSFIIPHCRFLRILEAGVDTFLSSIEIEKKEEISHVPMYSRTISIDSSASDDLGSRETKLQVPTLSYFSSPSVHFAFVLYHF